MCQAGRRCIQGVVGPTSSLCRVMDKSEKNDVDEGRGKVRHRRLDPCSRNIIFLLVVIPSNTELVKFGMNLAGPPVKPKYSLVTDSEQVP